MKLSTLSIAALLLMSLHFGACSDDISGSANSPINYPPAINTEGTTGHGGTGGTGGTGGSGTTGGQVKQYISEYYKYESKIDNSVMYQTELGQFLFEKDGTGTYRWHSARSIAYWNSYSHAYNWTRMVEEKEENSFTYTYDGTTMVLTWANGIPRIFQFYGSTLVYDGNTYEKQ